MLTIKRDIPKQMDSTLNSFVIPWLKSCKKEPETTTHPQFGSNSV